MSWQQNPRTVLIVLLVSLGVNCMVAGVFFSAALLYETHQNRVDEVRRMLDSVPRAIYPGLNDEVEAHSAEIRAVQHDLHSARQDAVRLMQADELDLDALRARLSAARLANGRMQDIMQESFVAALGRLPPEERSTVARQTLRNFSPVAKLFNRPQDGTDAR